MVRFLLVFYLFLMVGLIGLGATILKVNDNKQLNELNNLITNLKEVAKKENLSFDKSYLVLDEIDDPYICESIGDSKQDGLSCDLNDYEQYGYYRIIMKNKNINKEKN